MLPFGVPAADRWVRWALDRWRQQDPTRFANLHAWTGEPRWQTAPEAEVANRRDAFEAKRAAVLARLEGESDALAAAESDAVASATAGARRLLTDDGDSLKAAVVDALREFGFHVVDADDLPGRDIAGREDLQVTDPDEAGWVALAEVKGHRRGAQSSVLSSLRDYRDLYRDEHDEWPSTCWYIANQERHSDPATRGRPLASHADNVANFERVGGAVIDTRTLFTLVRRFAAASPQQLTTLRSRMRSTVGVWPYAPDEVWDL